MYPVCAAGGHRVPRRGLRCCSKLCDDLVRGKRTMSPKGAVITCCICDERRAVVHVNAKCCHAPACVKEHAYRRGVKWKRENPEKHLARGRRRDASRAGQVRGRHGKVEGVRYREIFERDGWVCGLCHEPVSPDLRMPDQMCASLDHIVPTALGGEHVLSNVHLAHLRCNLSKHTRAVNEQLLLVG